VWVEGEGGVHSCDRRLGPVSGTSPSMAIC
jgi:hypothetical protein